MNLRLFGTGATTRLSLGAGGRRRRRSFVRWLLRKGGW